MSRPRCFLCFKQLMYVNGQPVWGIYKDIGGVEHKVHKECLRQEKATEDLARTNEFQRDRWGH